MDFPQTSYIKTTIYVLHGGSYSRKNLKTYKKIPKEQIKVSISTSRNLVTFLLVHFYIFFIALGSSTSSLSHVLPASQRHDGSILTVINGAIVRGFVNLAKSLASTAVPESSSVAHHRQRPLTFARQVITLIEPR